MHPPFIYCHPHIEMPCYCCGRETAGQDACQCGWNPNTLVTDHLAQGCADADPESDRYEAYLVDEHEWRTN